MQATDPYALGPADRLGEFRIIRRLGEGGMGIVYLAHDEHLDRPVALKVIAPQLAHEPEFQKRFETEARSAAAIDDPHVVPVYSAGSADGRLYIAMRFVDGTDLRSVLAESDGIEPAAAVAIASDVASALDAAHSAGLVHRDVKPANILLAGDVGAGTAYLTDFGLTKGLHAEGTQLTGTGQWIGTLDYVAPEQMTTGTVDARTDVYALGCVLHEMIAGSVPFAGSDMQKMWGHVNEPMPLLAGDGSTHPLDPVIARATAKDPGERFPSAGDLAGAASAALRGTQVAKPERSVATGVAATGLLETAETPARTRTMKAPPPGQHAEPPTSRMPQPPPPPPRRHRDSGSTGRTAAVIGGSVVLAAGLLAAALVLSGGKGGDSRTVVNRNVEASAQAQPSADTQPTESANPEPSSAAAESSTSPTSATFSQALYSVAIPAGWAQEESDEPIANYLESTWHDPSDSNTTILIDAQTPGGSGSPVSDAESVRAQTSQSSGYREGGLEETVLGGRPAARWVFDVSGDRRVDYFFEECGVGVAVLGSTSPTTFGSLAPTFHQAASSVEIPCGE